MTLEELKAEIERLYRLIDHACEICDAPDHRNESAAVVVPLIMKRALAESELDLLLPRLTTEQRTFLRDEMINRKIKEQHNRSIETPGVKDDAATQIRRWRERWERISKFGGVVPTEIKGCDLLDEVTRDILKFVVVTKDEGQATTLWSTHAHVFPFGVFYYSPRLLVWSKVPGCGKTRLRNVTGQLVPNPISSSGITGTDLLALLKEYNDSPLILAGHWTSVGGLNGKKLTLLIDEGDNIMQTQKLRKIFNGNSWSDTIREKNRHSGLAEDISTFAPAALFEIDDAERNTPSMRSYPPFKDRSIEIELKQAQQDPEHDADPSDELFNSLGRELRPKIETWVEAHIDEIDETYRRLKKEIKNEELGKSHYSRSPARQLAPFDCDCRRRRRSLARNGQRALHQICPPSPYAC